MEKDFDVSLGEVSAEIRNKIQAAKTALELLKVGRKVSGVLIDAALNDLEKILKIIV